MNKILLLVIVALFSFVDINSQNIVIATQKESSVPIIDDIPIINNSSLKFEIMAKQLYVASQRVL